MTFGWMMGTLLVAVLTAACVGVGWLLLKRPIAVWVWGSRRALLRAGLKQVTLQTPVGPQVCFMGGTGPVLVLLHGAGDQAGTWLYVVASLVKRYTLVVPDLAGHGDSAPRTGPIPTSDIFSGLEVLIRSQTLEKPVILVGNSLGAWMAMVLAVRHPDWVERVIAVNGGPLRGASEDVRLVPRSREEARATMAQLRDPASPAIPDSVLDDLARQANTSALARLAETAESMEGWVLTEEQLQALRLPVRLIWGVSDGLMPLDYAQRMVAVLPDVELIPIDRCGHLPQREAPEPFKTALSQALSG